MNQLLKLTQLKEIFTSLNALIQEYSETQNAINKSFTETKNTILSAYNSEKNTITNSNNEKLSVELTDFNQKRELLEQEKKACLQSLHEAIENEKVSIKKSFEEVSESTMKEKRELVNKERQNHEDKIKLLTVTAESLINELKELLEKNASYQPLLKMSNIKVDKKDLFAEIFKSTEEEFSREELLIKHDYSVQSEKLRKISADNEKIYQSVKNSPITALFLKFPPWLSFLIIFFVHGTLYYFESFHPIPTLYILFSCIILSALTLIAFTLFKLTYSKKLKLIATNLSEIDALYHFCLETNQLQLNDALQNETARLKTTCEFSDAQGFAELKKIDLEQFAEFRDLKERYKKDHEEIALDIATRLETLAKEHEIRLDELETSCKEELTNLKERFEKDLKKVQLEEEQQLAITNEKWEAKWFAKLDEFEKLNLESKEREKQLFPPFNINIENWQPNAQFDGVCQFGLLKMDLFKELNFPADGSFDNKDSIPFSIPATLEFPNQASMLITTKDEGREQAIALLKNSVLRLLMTLPPGKARFNFVDPLSLGESFAGFMHLNDYKSELTGGRIATNTKQIEQYLHDLNEHMETVIQKYLRNEFSNICEYNEVVGEIAEPFRFLVVADFPVNFSDEAVRRIISIAKSGARCGVYILIHRDSRHPIPGGFDISEIEKQCININYLFGDLDWKNCGLKLADFEIETPPETHHMNELIKKIGSASINATRVEIPFEKIAFPKRWHASSASELSAAIGLTGAKKQEIIFGHGTNQHCLIAGKTGSGKSNLIHIIICNLALKYSPEELEFYLIDFKKGVEFKVYATSSLPHAKAIAIESDREFGLSVLRKLDKELQERGDALRRTGAQNITQFRQNGEKMGRILLVIDEFQEIFVEDDNIAQECSLLLDRIVRQGRAFGIHVILGSQTLAGSYTLPRSTMGQMTIRIALQCSESDSYIILNENNSAARLLERPGEAIYNDKAGLPDGNTPFQTAFLTDSQKISILESLQDPTHCPFVFEGNIPANILTNRDFQKLLTSPPNNQKQLILGEPNAIRPALSANFESSSGQNLLIVGQNEENALAVITSAISSLSLQFPPEELEFYLFDGSSADLPRQDFFNNIAKSLACKFSIITPSTAEESIQEIKSISSENNKKRFLIFHGFHKFRKLRQSDSFSWDDDTPSAAKTLAELFTDGPENNLHSILWCDSWNSLSRMAPRKILNDFDYRVLFQLSQTDSVALMDSAEATKLGLHTALLFNEQSGEMTKFRPFSLPNELWFEKLQKSTNLSIC